VHRWDNIDWSDLYPQRSLKVADSLETIVRTWVEVLGGVRPTYVPGQQVFALDSSTVPTDLIEKGIVTR
jgi:hypothetical protein